MSTRDAVTRVDKDHPLPGVYDNTRISRQTSFGVAVRVHATSHAASRRVLDVAVAAFELLASMMEIPLPLNKVDFIIVPNYDGGMENWGHVLLSENLASSGDDAHLSYVVAHELAHHWIGGKSTVNSWRWICLQDNRFGSEHNDVEMKEMAFESSERAMERQTTRSSWSR
ncbi:unnamed protein product [Angiostrongylus costaricensis]|uniref:Peptidase_M1 domain-containing protein n=1 Tax=Angiostrongylus costaricensis TaxID=334426 RepID=A0A0R3PZ02_ANGCS|nr:unnamed protein product [Angiostrongylus costaricensis]